MKGIQHAAHYCTHCGRQYTASHHLDVHQRKCKRAKSHLKELLGNTRIFWESRKRERLKASTQPRGSPSSANPEAIVVAQVHDSDEPMEVDDAPDRLEQGNAVTPAAENTDEPLGSPRDLDMPIGQRKAKRGSRMPKRFRDDSPAPPPPRRQRLGAQLSDADDEAPAAAQLAAANVQSLSPQRSTANVFGVTRIYSVPEQTPFTEGPDQVEDSGKASKTGQDQTKGVKEGPDQSEDSGKADETIEDQMTREAGGPDKPEDPGSADETVEDQTTRPPKPTKSIDLGPLTSESAFRLAEWFWSSPNKSFRDFQTLMGILRSPSFDLNSVTNINWKSTFKALGSNTEDAVDAEGWRSGGGWKCTTVSIKVPFHRLLKNNGLENYSAGKFYHRSLVSVIKEKLADPATKRHFHYQPYEERWQRNGDSPEVELFGELYGSRAFRQANDALQKLPATESNEGLERVIVALMLWSDGTHLTSFGTATLWPCYLFFGNESKNERYKSSTRLGRQVAYFTKLPANFNDYLKERSGGKMPKKELLAHCARELFHAQWSILLDQELLDAMKDGLIVACPDGKRRCFYPKIFTYSADYPERVLVAGVRNNGSYPCHRCLVEKPNVDKLGAPNDTERIQKMRCESEQATLVIQAKQTIEQGFAFDGPRVEADLFPQSLTATENAMYKALSPLQFSVIPSLVADLMHEFEIGVWKNLFIHLIRILYSSQAQANTTPWAELDSRYRSTPTFGRETIRKFHVNASEMKRKAARDYANLLQCAIPAFELLLPEPHNSIILTLLYICAQWHALAKLRSHNDLTLRLLEYTTTRFGGQMRLFNRETCSQFETKELRKEAEARVRRDAKKKKEAPKAGSTSRRATSLGVFTIKFHLLGDYCSVIRMFGTTDSYSTELGESFHRTPKSWYPRTDRKGYADQFTQMERRMARLSHMRAQIDDQSPPDGGSSTGMETGPDSDGGTNSPKNSRYSIGVNQNCPVHISFFQDTEDPGYRRSYFTDFIPKLKQHLLPRLLSRLGYPPGAEELCDWSKIVFDKDRLYSHKTMKIRYTTYDVRREEDVIHVDTPQCNIMLLNGHYRAGSWGSVCPYLYGKIISVLHANVSFAGILPDGRTDYTWHWIDLGWVHWYESLSFGEALKLDRVQLLPLDSGESLGFVDPSDIIRGVHLIPRFALGRSKLLTPPTKLVQKCELWNEYYVNRFADRDSFMRFQFGMSVGHTYMHSSDFPPAEIPSVPVDFDHCLDHEAVIRARKSAATMQGPSLDLPPGELPERSTMDESRGTGEAEDTLESGSTLHGAPGSGGSVDSDAPNTAFASSTQLEADEGDSGLSSDDSGESDEEEIDYFDNQNDWEIRTYDHDDMYAEDHFV